MSYFLRSRAVRSLPCSVKALVGIVPHAETPPPPVLSPEVTATQALELLASVSARIHVSEFRHRIFGETSINTTTTSTKPQSFNSVMQFFY